MIEELKLHKNKPAQRFQCRLLLQEPGHSVLWYSAPKAGAIRDIVLPAGTCTIAHYWNDRGYVLWRMFYPGGALAGTLFHICKDVALSSSRVSYLDLMVDIWVAPDSSVRVLDEDELAAGAAAGLVSADELLWITRQKELILKKYQAIIAEAITIETRIDLQKGVLRQ